MVAVVRLKYARMEGKRMAKFKKMEKDKLLQKARVTARIFFVVTVVNLAIMMVTGVYGSLSRLEITEAQVSQMSDAELQRIYYTPLTTAIDEAVLPVKIFYAAGLLALWGVCNWHWDIIASMYFSIAMVWEIVAVIACGLPWLKWQKQLRAKTTEAPEVVDLKKFMDDNQKKADEERRRQEMAKKKLKEELAAQSGDISKTPTKDLVKNVLDTLK